ncbi:MAG: Diaminopimelate epimerase [Chlamydiae bacterium]|nr:Diaminopimelate epimerase [Chlamydiota bacterium]
MMQYYLAEACENTFILFDCLDKNSVSEEFLDIAYEYLYEEERKDALILINARGVGDVFFAEMLVLGLDGELGEFCGNGARACAAYIFEQYPFFKEYYLVTKWGALLLKNHGQGIYSIKLPKSSFELNQKFVAIPELYGLQHVEVLEPHLTLEKKMSDEALFFLRRELNKHKNVFPHGINAWYPLEEGCLFVKTYERGVQGLTRSCGTGSTACAVFYHSSGDVLMSTPGGLLEIALEEKEIELKGPAFFFQKGKKGKGS